jgi:hypothetical protein
MLRIDSSQCLNHYIHVLTVLAKWRVPMGDSGILKFFLQILSTALESKLRIQILRLIGNSCADTGIEALRNTLYQTDRR